MSTPSWYCQRWHGCFVYMGAQCVNIFCCKPVDLAKTIDNLIPSLLILVDDYAKLGVRRFVEHVADVKPHLAPRHKVV